MVIYIDHTAGSQFLMARGLPMAEDEIKTLKGMTIKNIQKIDGKYQITLK